MTRQSISFTPQNDAWLNTQVSNGEYASKSEIINELIRQARAHQQEIDYIRAALIKGEQSGISTSTKEEIREKARTLLRENGTLSTH